MTTRLSRERAVTSALDHLHTAGPALARFASNGAEDGAPVSSDETDAGGARPAAARSFIERVRGPRRRTPAPPRWRLAFVVPAILLTAFSGATLAGSASNPTPAPNSVLTFGAARAFGSAANLDLRRGVVAIASDPAGPGYWLAASDGGVFAFGSASFFGSTGSTPLSAPMVGIAPTPHGRGYWLVGADGGVFAFGDARFFGSAQSLKITSPIVGAAATRTGHGYWLLGSDGGVFSFGDARFAGARPDGSQRAVGIAAARNGRGYWIARADGSVLGFNALPRGNDAVFKSEPGTAKTVAIAASSTGGYWIAQGELDPATIIPSLSADPFLACTRAHESDNSGGYQAISAGGTYRGAYQFDRSTWNSAAMLAGRPDLVGVDPAAAAPADQDLLALALYHARGTQPWGGRCGGLS